MFLTNASAAYDPYVQQRLAAAEAVWIAGGDQWDYVQYWRGTPIDSLLNVGLQQRQLVLGGTSAGMAIQGGAYFSAQNGSITSNAAVANPYDSRLVVDTTPFLQNRYLQAVITDTHYDNPSREGRQLTFMARMLQDYGYAEAKGIACDEYTAVCIDTNGIARVFGGFPTYDDNAYFLQVNCALSNPLPEQCQAGSPLIWNRNGQAVTVYAIKGTATGNNSFDLKDWRSATGGSWEYWSLNSSGSLSKGAATAPTCFVLASATRLAPNTVRVYPNPCTEVVHLEAPQLEAVQLVNLLGVVVWETELAACSSYSLSTGHLSEGCYMLRWRSKGYWTSQLLQKQ